MASKFPMAAIRNSDKPQPGVFLPGNVQVRECLELPVQVCVSRLPRCVFYRCLCGPSAFVRPRVPAPRCLFTGTLRKLRARQLVCSEEAFAGCTCVPATAPSASLVPTTCLLYFGTYRYRTYRSGKPLNTSSPLPIGGP